MKEMLAALSEAVLPTEGSIKVLMFNDKGITKWMQNSIEFTFYLLTMSQGAPAGQTKRLHGFTFDFKKVSTCCSVLEQICFPSSGYAIIRTLCITALRINPRVAHLDSILLGPLSSSGLILRSVRLVNVSNLRDQWVIGVGVSQQGANGQKHLRDGKGRRPLVLQNI